MFRPCVKSRKHSPGFEEQPHSLKGEGNSIHCWSPSDLSMELNVCV
jgi:hypothetical protein